MDSTQLKKELENRILEAIRAQWVSIWNETSTKFRSRLKEPNFSLFDDPTGGGEYNPEKNQIRFTKTCAFYLTWDSIVNTLRHEMAHQLACTFPESLGQKPHGPLFKQCCDILNVDLNFIPIPVGWKCFEDRIIENHDILLRKIHKLIRLVEIGNNESRDAYIKAKSLIKELHRESTSF